MLSLAIVEDVSVVIIVCGANARGLRPIKMIKVWMLPSSLMNSLCYPSLGQVLIPNNMTLIDNFTISILIY